MAHHARYPVQHEGFTGDEIAAMAEVLARRYGAEAGAVALHFAAEHESVGDDIRSTAWRRVARALRTRNAAPTLS
jgi:hypothetical protein